MSNFFFCHNVFKSYLLFNLLKTVWLKQKQCVYGKCSLLLCKFKDITNLTLLIVGQKRVCKLTALRTHIFIQDNSVTLVHKLSRISNRKQQMHNFNIILYALVIVFCLCSRIHIQELVYLFYSFPMYNKSAAE